jgi:hypothetical protein
VGSNPTRATPNGGVAQTARALACQARGRRFEPGRPRCGRGVAASIRGRDPRGAGSNPAGHLISRRGPERLGYLWAERPRPCGSIPRADRTPRPRLTQRRCCGPEHRRLPVERPTRASGGRRLQVAPGARAPELSSPRRAPPRPRSSFNSGCGPERHRLSPQEREGGGGRDPILRARQGDGAWRPHPLRRAPSGPHTTTTASTCANHQHPRKEV